MQRIRDPRPPEPEGRSSGRTPVRIPDGEDPDDLFARYAAALDQRLQQGLAEIHRSATRVMRQLVAEVWQATGPEAATHLRDGVMGSIARDDALRGLLTHTDERYQAISVRMQEMESAVRQLAEATREAVRRARSADQHAERSEGAALLERLARSMVPLTQRMDAIVAALGQQQERHREDLVRFGERTARVLGEVHRRLQDDVRSEMEEVRESIRGELQRLEAAVLSETAFGADAVAGLHSALDGLGERTGNVVEFLGRRVAERLDEQRHDATAAAERSVAVTSQVQERLDSLEQGFVRQLEDLMAVSARMERGVGEASQRLLGSLGEIVARMEATEERAGSLESAFDRQRAELHELTTRAGRGLEELSRRIHGRLQEVVDRSVDGNRRAVEAIEASLRREIGEVRSEVREVAGRTGDVLEGLRTELGDRVDRAARSGEEATERIATELAQRQSARQAGSLETIARSLQALFDSVRRSAHQQTASVERVLRASAGRQEAVLDETLAALRTTIQELSGPSAPLPSDQDGGTGGRALTRRLREAERRLAQLSQELVGERSPQG